MLSSPQIAKVHLDQVCRAGPGRRHRRSENKSPALRRLVLSQICTARSLRLTHSASLEFHSCLLVLFSLPSCRETKCSGPPSCCWQGSAPSPRPSMTKTPTGGSTTSAASSPPTMTPMSLTLMSPMSLTLMGWRKVQPMLTALYPHQIPVTVPRSATAHLTFPQPCTVTTATSNTCPSSPPA